ncbi:MAG: hypothetical protein GY714_31385 [Desulfobacterales bacterium]|nr:hypothetical protein [Desulfobacterales bacterium]
MSKKTINPYAKTVRRFNNCFNCYPDRLNSDDIEDYFESLIKLTISQFFWRFVLNLSSSLLSVIYPFQNTTAAINTNGFIYIFRNSESVLIIKIHLESLFSPTQNIIFKGFGIKPVRQL